MTETCGHVRDMLPENPNHVVKVQLQGYFEKKPVWRWDCTCGKKGVMHPSEKGCELEAQAHVEELRRRPVLHLKDQDRIKEATKCSCVTSATTPSAQWSSPRT